jgi:hypothetical protein
MEVLPALPSDLLLMSVGLDGRSAWLDPGAPVPVAHLVRAAVRLRRRLAEVVGRFAVLGYATADISQMPEDLTSDDTVLISRDLDGVPPWLDREAPVPVGHLVRAAVRLRRGPAEVAERLAAFGYATPDISQLPEDLTSDDTILISRDLNGGRPWLDRAAPVPVGHLVQAAVRLRRGPAEVAERLATLGYATADISQIPEEVTEDDAVLLNPSLVERSTYRRMRPPWLDPGAPVPVGHLVQAAVQLRRGPAEVAERLAAFGYATPDISQLPEDLTSDDALLVSDNLSGRPPSLDPNAPVPIAHLSQAAVRLRRGPAEVAERLAAFGYATPDISQLPEDLTSDDALLIRVDADARQQARIDQARWLQPTAPVSLHHVIRTAVRLRRGPAEVAERLAALGYNAPDLARLLPRPRPGG